MTTCFYLKCSFALIQFRIKKIIKFTSLISFIHLEYVYLYYLLSSSGDWIPLSSLVKFNFFITTSKEIEGINNTTNFSATTKGSQRKDCRVFGLGFFFRRSGHSQSLCIVFRAFFLFLLGVYKVGSSISYRYG